MSTTTQSASFADIAAAVRDQLINVTGLDRNYVNFAADDKFNGSSAETAVFIRCYGIQPDTDAGAGRRARPAYRRLRVYLDSRNSLDYYGDNFFRLFGEGSHDYYETKVIDALDEFIPTKMVDGEAVCLVLEPLHFLDSSDGPPAAVPDADTGICRSHLDWQVRWLLPNQTPQP